MTDGSGLKTTFNYDALNRVTQVGFPDSSYNEYVYTNMSLTQTRDQQGRWTRYFYNPNQQMIGSLDADDRAISYDRCSCGELKGVTDPLGHRTSWTLDIEGRVITKTFFDNSAINYTYENTTSRVKTFIDAKGQQTIYTYNSDSSLNNIAYTNATVSTPTVSFAYDPVYPRVTAMVDGTGSTTYTYNPVVSGSLGSGRLATETGPLDPTSAIAYSYDQLGQVTATSVNGVSSTVGYDSENVQI
jgi:YD repeat-containing protein